MKLSMCLAVISQQADHLKGLNKYFDCKFSAFCLYVKHVTLNLALPMNLSGAIPSDGTSVGSQPKDQPNLETLTWKPSTKKYCLSTTIVGKPPVYTSYHAMIGGIDRFQSHKHI